MTPDLPKLALIERIDWAKINLKPRPTDYRIVWEDPDTPEACVKVICPSANFMAMALHGDIIPPAWVKIAVREGVDEKGRVTNGHLLHDTQPLGPLTEEEAMEWLAEVYVPERVWKQQHNRPLMVICRTDQLPGTRVFRDAWHVRSDIGSVQ